MRRLVLAGGGHAHLSVLQALAERRPENVEVVLVTPIPVSVYSGMVPGWMAGHYALDELRINVAVLAERAGVRVELASVAGLSAACRELTLSDGRRLPYDMLSLDVGSEIDLAPFAALGERALAIRPLDRFVAQWISVVERAAGQAAFHLAVVGAGAAGVELAFAARHAFERRGAKARVRLVGAADGILEGLAPRAAARVRQLLEQHGVETLHANASGNALGLRVSEIEVLPVDVALIATGGRPPRWLGGSGLLLDRTGRVAVHANHRSVSHLNVFAAGDVCSRVGQELSRSGVHAVHAGPVLANNLLAALHGHELDEYVPRRHSLYLISTGDKHAVLAWGPVSASGTWVWHWKRFLDRRFVRRYQVDAHRSDA